MQHSLFRFLSGFLYGFSALVFALSVSVANANDVSIDAQENNALATEEPTSIDITPEGASQQNLANSDAVGTLVLVVEQYNDLVSIVRATRLQASFPFTPYSENLLDKQQQTELNSSQTSKSDPTLIDSENSQQVALNDSSQAPSLAPLTIEWFDSQQQLLDTQQVKPVDQTSIAMKDKVRYSLRLPWVSQAKFIRVIDKRFTLPHSTEPNASLVSLEQLLANQVSILDTIETEKTETIPSPKNQNSTIDGVENTEKTATLNSESTKAN